MIVVILGFHSRIRIVLDGGMQAELLGDLFDHVRELVDRVRFIELVEHAILSSRDRILDGKSQRLHRIFEGDVAPSLPAAAIGGDRESEDRLDDESI